MNKNRKKSANRVISLLSLVLILALVLSVPTFAFSKDQAFKKALKSAHLTKAQVTHIEKDYDDGKYEVEFTRRSNKAEYSFEYSKKGVLLEKSVDYNHKANYKAKKLSKAQAINKVVKFGGFKKATVKNGTCKLTKDDGQHVYKLKFKTSTYRYEYEVHARTGYVLEYSKERR